MQTIGFLGVGTMGAPMARNLARGDFEVTAFDVSRDAVAALADVGVTAADSAAEAVKGKDFVITMLPNGSVVESALFGADGIAGKLSPETILIDMSTILPAQTDSIHKRLREAGVAVVDAPVGRSSQHAVDGKLMIMIGGRDADVEKVRPVLGLLGDTLIHCGPGGYGQRMKIVNNYMSIALNVLTSEAFVLAESSGLDVELAREVMMGTVAGQGHMGTTYPAKVLKGDLTPGFMVDLAHKDLGLALDMAGELDLPVFLGAAAHQSYAIARRDGRGRQDWTALYESMRELAATRGSS